MVWKAWYRRRHCRTRMRGTGLLPATALRSLAVPAEDHIDCFLGSGPELRACRMIPDFIERSLRFLGAEKKHYIDAAIAIGVYPGLIFFGIAHNKAVFACVLVVRLDAGSLQKSADLVVVVNEHCTLPAL